MVKELLIAYILWIGLNTSYDVSKVNIPRVKFNTQQELNHIYYGNTACKTGESPNIVAAYTGENEGTVHLNKKFDVKNVEDQSTLFHEAFHHVQNSNNVGRLKSPKEREEEAIAVENMWRIKKELPKLTRQVSTDFCK